MAIAAFPQQQYHLVQTSMLQHEAYSGTLTRREIVRANASLGELRRDKENLARLSVAS